MKTLYALCAASLLLSTASARAEPAAGEGALFPLPAELEGDVRFWRRVYTEVGGDGGFIHDSRDLRVVYEVVRFDAGARSKARERHVERVKRRYRDVLLKLARGKRSHLTKDERQVLELFPDGVSNERFRKAANSLRFQLGQADKFRAGLIRSGAWREHILATLREMGLPEQLIALPHVESSFTPTAYSRVGAAGLWQFTRSTGRRYMRVDHVVDERMDPLIAAVAAARLLQHNRQSTGTWPLALTAYNHGAAGMRRAARVVGTRDIAVIARKYKSRTFGFASRNFYVEFLAALEVDRNAERYFGVLPRHEPVDYEVAEMSAFVPAKPLVRALGIDLDTLKKHNPALRPPVWNGSKRVPKGFELRVPRDHLAQPLETLLAGVPEEQRFASQTRDTYHKVRRGESLSVIAARYGVRINDLVVMNGLRSRHSIRAGQNLRLPVEGAPTRTRQAAAAAAPARATDGVYTVRGGDTVSRIATRFGVSERELMRWNGLANRNRIHVGQELRVEPGETRAQTPALAAAPSAAPTVAPAPAPATPPAPVEYAALPETEPAGPGLAQTEPGAESLLQADPNDYSVAPNDTIEIQAAETLGHYAEWLDIRASRLRSLNGMRYGTPLVVGERLRMDFAEISREEFETRRNEHHQMLQQAFFEQNEIVGTETHVIRSGDSIWKLAQSRYDVPLWLVRQYNPDVDFAELHAGARLAFPAIRPRSTN